MSSWRRHPVIETIFECLKEQLQDEMLDTIELSKRGNSELHEIVAEKRAQYKLFEDLYFLDNLAIRLENKLEIVDDTETGE